MIFVYVLVAWGFLAAISLVIDSILICLTLTGRNGGAALELLQDIAFRHGGMRRWVVTCLAWDIFEPWQTIWQAILFACR